MGELSVTTIDVLVIAVILVSAGFAMFRGLVHETFAILEWVAGIYVALRFTPVFQPLLNGIISPPWLEWGAVFVGTFLLVFIPLSIMSHRLSERVRKSDIGPVDRTLGLVFGATRGLVIVGLVYLAFGALVPLKDHPDALTKARLFPLIRNTGAVLRSLAPGITEPFGLAESAPQEGPAANATQETREQQAAPKTYGANERSALDRLFQANGGSDSPSR
jgi:membrane protein required for colicin V production